MSPMRSRLAVLLALLTPIVALGSCGQSDLQKQAIEANDVIPTTDQAAEAARQRKIAKKNAALDAAERKDRQGLAKDVVDAARGAQTDAEQAAAKVQTDAQQAAANEVSKAQIQADKVRAEVQKNVDAASDAISNALKATTP